MARLYALACACVLAGISTAVAASDFGFNVDVVLSPRAAATLAANKEAITLYVEYFGDPKPDALKHANEIGQIDVQRRRGPVDDELVALPGTGGLAHISGVNIDPHRLAWVEGPLKVNVNVASARKSGPDNLLACDFIEATVAEVQKHSPVRLDCWLIAEAHRETRVRP